MQAKTSKVSFAFDTSQTFPSSLRRRWCEKYSSRAQNRYFAHTITTTEEREREALRIREAKLVIRGGSADLLLDGEQAKKETVPRRGRTKNNKKIAWGGGKASDEAWARSTSTPRLHSPPRTANGPLGPGFSPGRSRDLDLTVRSMQVEHARHSRLARAEARRFVHLSCCE